MATLTLSVATVKPLGDRILVKVSESEEKTAGGILLPDTAKEKPQRGTVVNKIVYTAVLAARFLREAVEAELDSFRQGMDRLAKASLTLTDRLHHQEKVTP